MRSFEKRNKIKWCNERAFSGLKPLPEIKKHTVIESLINYIGHFYESKPKSVSMFLV